MTDKEILAIINKVTLRVTGGDVAALNDLKTLPNDFAVPSLLMFFRQNHFVLHETPQNRAIAAKASQLVLEIPDADVYLKGLFKKQSTADLPGWFLSQRNAAVACLVQLHNKFAIRAVANSLTDPDVGIDLATLAGALADMNIPSAPYSKATRKQSSSADGIAKWQQWWQENKAQYTEHAQ